MAPSTCSGRSAPGQDYEALLGASEVLALGTVSVGVLGLAALIRTKEAAGRPTDLAVLPLLRRALAERGL